MTEHRTITIDWWRNKADKPVVLAIVIFHILAFCAPAFFSWSGLGLFFLFYWISGGLGITLCYHRLLTHKSFKTSKFLRRTLTTFACLAMQGGPEEWVGTHRYHHNHSDTDKDPHSPKHGFAWSHILWVLTHAPEGFSPLDYSKDLAKDPFMLFLRKYWLLPQFILTTLLFVLGFQIGGFYLAISWVSWDTLRVIAVFHSTWFVNSATHKWGYKNFHNTGDDSRNLWWVALLTFGEGWHNNHHAVPSSAAHGMKRFEFDLTYWTIKIMSKIGLVWDIKKPFKI